MGRPPVPAHLKRDKRLGVMLTEAEFETYTEAAKAAGAGSLSDWVRDLLGEAARKLLKGRKSTPEDRGERRG